MGLRILLIRGSPGDTTPAADDDGGRVLFSLQSTNAAKNSSGVLLPRSTRNSSRLTGSSDVFFGGDV